MDIYKYIEVMEKPKECPICGAPEEFIDECEPANINDIKWRCSICSQPIHYGKNSIISDRYFHCYLYYHNGFWGIRNRVVLRFDIENNTAKGLFITKGNILPFEVKQETIDLLSIKENREKMLYLQNEYSVHAYDAASYGFKFFQGHRKCSYQCCYKDFFRLKILGDLYESIDNAIVF